jgi:hypothetical protein
MLSYKMIKRGLAGVLVFAAAGFPAAAQASFMADAGGGSAPATLAASGHRAVQQGGSGFQWGDAGIGAAAAITVLGAGAASSGVARRRRVQRTVVG